MARFTYRSGPGRRPLGPLGVLVVCACAGLACLIAGAVYLGRGDPDARQKEVDAFNAAVSFWPRAKERFVDQGPFRVVIDQSVSINATVATAALAYEQAPLEMGAGIASFPAEDRLIFTSSANPFMFASIPVGDHTTRTVALYDKNDQLVATTSIDISNYRTAASSKSSTNSFRYCNYGTLQGTSCKMWFYLSGQICLTVDASSRIVGGCALISEDTADAQGYGSLDPSQNTGPSRLSSTTYTYSANQMGAVTWPGGASPQFSVVIRSASDPYAVAATVTGGYVSQFGARSAALLKKGTILAAVGGSLLIPFALCAIGVCLCAFKDSSRFGSSNYYGGGSAIGNGGYSARRGSVLTSSLPSLVVGNPTRSDGGVGGTNGGGFDTSSASFRNELAALENAVASQQARGRPTFTQSIKMRSWDAMMYAAVPIEGVKRGIRSASGRVVATFSKRRVDYNSGSSSSAAATPSAPPPGLLRPSNGVSSPPPMRLSTVTANPLDPVLLSPALGSNSNSGNNYGKVPAASAPLAL